MLQRLRDTSSFSVSIVCATRVPRKEASSFAAAENPTPADTSGLDRQRFALAAGLPCRNGARIFINNRPSIFFLVTFALRSPHGARQIRIYEVDHAATQAWKRLRLAEAQLALPPWLIFVPVDFERDDLGDTLVGAGFQQNSPAFFTWLGVVSCPAFVLLSLLVEFLESGLKPWPFAD